MDLKKTLLELCAAPGVSGAEEKAAHAAMDALRPYVDEVSLTPLGSVVGTMRGEGPVVALDAHIDQIGLIITDYGGNGFLRFDKCGGIDTRTLAGLEVTIHGTEDLYGVVSSIPPHLAKKEDEGKAKDCKDLAIDTGLSEEELKQKVRRGDRASFKAYPSELLNGQVSAPALDDRAGVAVLIRTAELLKEADSKRNVHIQFSVREEVGGKAAAATAYPEDVATAIAVDVSFARTPGVADRDAAVLGKGPMIGYAPILDKGLFEDMKRIASEKDIPYQLEIMHRGTGTHADEFTNSKAGIRTGLLSIPLKYMHTPVEVVALEDLENTAQLLAATILEGGAV